MSNPAIELETPLVPELSPIEAKAGAWDKVDRFVGNLLSLLVFGFGLLSPVLAYLWAMFGG